MAGAHFNPPNLNNINDKCKTTLCISIGFIVASIASLLIGGRAGLPELKGVLPLALGMGTCGGILMGCYSKKLCGYYVKACIYFGCQEDQEMDLEDLENGILPTTQQATPSPMMVITFPIVGPEDGLMLPASMMVPHIQNIIPEGSSGRTLTFFSDNSRRGLTSIVSVTEQKSSLENTFS